MSPLLDMQEQFRELGRLRMGQQVPTGSGGKTRPTKLDTWRVTSAGEGGRTLLEHVARLYGGTVQQWQNPRVDGEHWEVVTEAASLAISVPAVVSLHAVLDQWWELWGGGGNKKRCDGFNQRGRAVPCSCPRDIDERIAAAQKKPPQACSPITRLWVLLPGIPDVGTWRLETHGRNAAQEMAAVFKILHMARIGGVILPAKLTIQQRQIKKEGEPTAKFGVPVIELEQTMDEIANTMLQLNAGEENQDRPALASGRVEPKTMPGVPPALHTDDDGAPPTPPLNAAAFSGPIDTPTPGTSEALEPWIVRLPGDDGLILDEAAALVQERGWSRPIGDLHDLQGMPPTEQEELKRRIEARLAALAAEDEGQLTWEQ